MNHLLSRLGGPRRARTSILAPCVSVALSLLSLLGVLLVSPASAMAFTPRLTAPSTSDYHYTSTQNPFVASGWPMPNCTCYAWGRAWEIRGTPLPKGCYLGNANTWYGETALPKGPPSSPALGAIAVWGGAPGDPNGHVAVVEAIDGSSVTVSQSNHLGRWFDTQTVQDISTYGGCGALLGYIYTIDDTTPAGTPPSMPSVTAPSETDDPSALTASWSVADPGTGGITEYDYAVGTAVTAASASGWVSAGSNTQATITGLDLQPGTAYYVSVKAKNGAGLWSGVGVSGPIVLDAAFHGSLRLGLTAHSLDKSYVPIVPLWSPDDMPQGATPSQTFTTPSDGMVAVRCEYYLPDASSNTHMLMDGHEVRHWVGGSDAGFVRETTLYLFLKAGSHTLAFTQQAGDTWVSAVSVGLDSGTTGTSASATSITIKTTATATAIGKTPILSGAVTPTDCIGENMVVYVMKPGSARWTYSSNRTVYALGAGAAWQYKYTFKRGMTKGVYKFKAVMSAWPGYLTSTSPTTVNIRLK